MLPFSLPPPDGTSNSPEWTGAGFRLGDVLVPVLEYNENFAGWSDDLTALHEDAAGDAHPIDTASRQDAVAQLRLHLTHLVAPTILEVGCSSGFMVRNLCAAFPTATIIGADVVREPLFKLAEELPSMPLMRFDLLKCPLPSASFDAVVMLNVLEHIEDDLTALHQVYRLLKPNGVIVIEVPAGPHLYDAYDKALMHFRRYRMAELSDKLRQAGFTLIRRSHLGFLVYPAFAYVKHRNRRAPPSGDLRQVVTNQASNTSTSKLLKMAMLIDHQLGRMFSLPYGIRCLAVGKKMGQPSLQRKMVPTLPENQMDVQLSLKWVGDELETLATTSRS